VLGRGDQRTTGEEATDEGEGISVEGGNVLMRSVLIDAVETVQAGSKDAKDIAQLANAWARLNAGKMEEEKLKLRTEDARQAAFDEIGRDVRGNPEAMVLFEKLRAVMTAGKKEE